MLGRGLSVIAAIGLINSFYMNWYAFPGTENTTPLSVFNYYMSQPINFDSLWHMGTMAGIVVLAGLMFLTVIFSKLYLSAAKLAIAAGLFIFHVGYFYNNVISQQAQSTPWDLLQIVNTSPGFLLFTGALVLYFVSVLFSIIFSPLRGAAKLVGL